MESKQKDKKRFGLEEIKSIDSEIMNESIACFDELLRKMRFKVEKSTIPNNGRIILNT